ncbi:hypothetical protein [Mycolicibacterium rutilum]|uniref:hypothetical protein n=1 Tax=Mycolicibacterium rutilum TaxID=370526 RepID=UPI0012FFC25C|nr:hypothetical protein [Mycolicibacterium rutilum]
MRDGEASAKKAAARKVPAKRAPRKVTPVSVTAAARSGDRRQLLVAMRNRIAAALDDPATKPTALAALIRQQTLIAAEIEAIDKPARGRDTSGDWLAAILAMPASEPWDEAMI